MKIALQFVSLSACFASVDSATLDDRPSLSSIDITKEHLIITSTYLDKVRCKLIKQYKYITYLTYPRL